MPTEPDDSNSGLRLIMILLVGAGARLDRHGLSRYGVFASDQDATVVILCGSGESRLQEYCQALATICNDAHVASLVLQEDPPVFDGLDLLEKMIRGQGYDPDLYRLEFYPVDLDQGLVTSAVNEKFGDYKRKVLPFLMYSAT